MAAITSSETCWWSIVDLNNNAAVWWLFKTRTFNEIGKEKATFGDEKKKIIKRKFPIWFIKYTFRGDSDATHSSSWQRYPFLSVYILLRVIQLLFEQISRSFVTKPRSGNTFFSRPLYIKSSLKWRRASCTFSLVFLFDAVAFFQRYYIMERFDLNGLRIIRFSKRDIFHPRCWFLFNFMHIHFLKITTRIYYIKLYTLWIALDFNYITHCYLINYTAALFKRIGKSACAFPMPPLRHRAH